MQQNNKNIKIFCSEIIIFAYDVNNSLTKNVNSVIKRPID